MLVDGENAKLYDAVRLDDFTAVNKGPLISANEETGSVVFIDSAGNHVGASMGPGTIRIVRRSR